MSDKIPLEIVLIVTASAIAFAAFVLICFCTRNRAQEERGNQNHGHSTYVGTIGWFQRYQDRNVSKDDSSGFTNRL